MKIKTFTYLKTGFLSFLLIGMLACKHDDEENFVFNGLDDSYIIERFEVLSIPTNISGNFTWSVNDSIVSQVQNLNLSVR